MAAVSEKMSSKSRQEFYDLKQQAVLYYNENGVPQKMEEILNSMFYDKPNDVYGHLANYFEKFTQTPLINKIIPKLRLDSKGQPTLQTSVYCTIKNIDKCTARVVCPSPIPYSETGRPEEKEAEEQERKLDLETCLNLIQTEINEKLSSLDPTQQTDIDNIIYEMIKKKKDEADALLESEVKDSPEPVANPPPPVESPTNKKKLASGKKGKAASLIIVVPDEPREKYIAGTSSISAISQAICTSASYIKQIPLYQHISDLFYSEKPEAHSIPIPMITILQTGKVSTAKLKCIKEFMVIPKPGMCMTEVLQHVQGIYNHIKKSMALKQGPSAKYVNDLGALCPLLEKPEQGLDMIQEAITSLGLQPGTDFHIGLNMAAHEVFDYDKGKYEVSTGQLKSADDMVDYWVDIISKYSSIIAIIDPFRKQESGAWMKLCDKISTQCYIIGDHVYHRPGLLKDEEITDQFVTSGVVYRLQHMNTITDIMTCVQNMTGNCTVVSTNLGDTTDDFVVDLAVGIGAKFVKIGAPCRGERTSKLNRLLDIEEQLKEDNKFISQSEHNIPRIDLPPTPEGEEEHVEQPPSPRKDGKKK